MKIFILIFILNFTGIAKPLITFDLFMVPLTKKKQKQKKAAALGGVVN